VSRQDGSWFCGELDESLRRCDVNAPNQFVSGAKGSVADQNSASAPPAISLPKGGGAIRGMGEKFAANPVTGTGSMTVPIATSPGRSGFGPQLALLLVNYTASFSYSDDLNNKDKQTFIFTAAADPAGPTQGSARETWRYE